MTESNSVVPPEPEFFEIFTDRLRLRTVRLSDAEGVMPLITRPDVMYWTSRGPVSTIDEARRWVSDRAIGKDVFNFAIELREADVTTSEPKPIVGLAGSFHLPEIGYMIHPDYAGKGYATEAIQGVIPHLFERFPPASEGGIGFDYLEGWTDINNRASQRILLKCGFTKCEIIPDPDNQIRGPSELVIFRKARPGKTLESLGLLPSKTAEDAPPEPPIE